MLKIGDSVFKIFLNSNFINEPLLNVVEYKIDSVEDSFRGLFYKLVNQEINDSIVIDEYMLKTELNTGNYLGSSNINFSKEIFISDFSKLDYELNNLWQRIKSNFLPIIKTFNLEIANFDNPNYLLTKNPLSSPQFAYDRMQDFLAKGTDGYGELFYEFFFFLGDLSEYENNAGIQIVQGHILSSEDLEEEIEQDEFDVDSMYYQAYSEEIVLFRSYNFRDLEPYYSDYDDFKLTNPNELMTQIESTNKPMLMLSYKYIPSSNLTPDLLNEEFNKFKNSLSKVLMEKGALIQKMESILKEDSPYSCINQIYLK